MCVNRTAGSNVFTEHNCRYSGRSNALCHLHRTSSKVIKHQSIMHPSFSISPLATVALFFSFSHFSHFSCFEYCLVFCRCDRSSFHFVFFRRQTEVRMCEVARPRRRYSNVPNFSLRCGVTAALSTSFPNINKDRSLCVHPRLMASGTRRRRGGPSRAPTLRP